MVLRKLSKFWVDRALGLSEWESQLRVTILEVGTGGEVGQLMLVWLIPSWEWRVFFRIPVCKGGVLKESIVGLIWFNLVTFQIKIIKSTVIFIHSSYSTVPFYSNFPVFSKRYRSPLVFPSPLGRPSYDGNLKGIKLGTSPKWKKSTHGLCFCNKFVRPTDYHRQPVPIYIYID